MPVFADERTDPRHATSAKRVAVHGALPAESSLNILLLLFIDGVSEVLVLVGVFFVVFLLFNFVILY